jgi:hypothetical protein
MLDLLNKTMEENISKAKNVLDSQNSLLYRPYFTQFYEFKNEYRVYFIKTEDKITIYSIKQKQLSISPESLFE